MISKNCTACELDKPLEDYYDDPRGKYGKWARCKSCHYVLNKYREKDPLRQEYQRKRRLEERFGLDYADLILLVESLYEKQKGQCASCGIKGPVSMGSKEHRNSNSLVLDHCHKAQNIRGLLCHKCNKALGLLNDSKEIIMGLHEYLDTYELTFPANG